MHSSFLTWLNGGLALYSAVLFFKLIIQFGLPNHPARFTSYLLSACVSGFLIMETATALSLVGPMTWMKWRAFPLIIGSLLLITQVIMVSGLFSYSQLRLVSRMPLIAGVICFSFFPSKANLFFSLGVMIGCLFLIVSVGKARYQKRAFLKMSLFLLFIFLCRYPGEYWVFCIGQVFLFFSIFYFYLFEHTFGIAALVESFEPEKGISA